jgi:hypothetical protein
MLAETAAAPTMMSSIAALVQAVVWPAVVCYFLFAYRKRIESLLEILGQKLSAATTIKAWQIEVESTAQDIKDVVTKAGNAATPSNTLGAIPKSQLAAAEEVKARIENSSIPDARALPAVQEQLYQLIHDYDQARTELQSGFARTKKMVSIVAGMRTLSLAARPLLTQLMGETSDGAKLAAVCILQMSPDYEYLDWLNDLLQDEKQAFVLFQAALALLELVQNKKYEDAARVRDVIAGAISVISSYKEGTPDQNTLQVLQTALAKL